MSSEWQSVALKDTLLRIQSGYWGEERPTEERPNVVRVIRNADVTRDGKRKSFAVRALSDRECEKSALCVGDIALATSGDVGKAWLVDEDGYHATNFLKRLTVNPSIAVPGFIRNLFDWESLKRDMAAHTGGSAIQNLRRSFFESTWVTLPPLAEQRRIVDLLGAVDRYIASLQAQVQATRAARSAVVLELLSNPADDWRQTTFGDVAEWSSGKSLPADRRIAGGKYRVLGASSEIARTDDWLIDFDAVLVGRVGAVGVVQRTSGPVWISDNALIARPTESLHVDFLAIMLEFFDFSPIVSGNAQPVITQGRLKQQSVIVPPRAQQQRIVELVRSVDQQVGSLEFQILSTQRFRGSVLSELLSGGRLLDESYDEAVSL